MEKKRTISKKDIISNNFISNITLKIRSTSVFKLILIPIVFQMTGKKGERVAFDGICYSTRPRRVVTK